MAKMLLTIADTALGVNVEVRGDVMPIVVGSGGSRMPAKSATLAQCWTLALLDILRVNLGLELELTEREVVVDAA